MLFFIFKPIARQHYLPPHHATMLLLLQQSCQGYPRTQTSFAVSVLVDRVRFERTKPKQQIYSLPVLTTYLPIPVFCVFTWICICLRMTIRIKEFYSFFLVYVYKKKWVAGDGFEPPTLGLWPRRASRLHVNIILCRQQNLL